VLVEAITDYGKRTQKRQQAQPQMKNVEVSIRMEWALIWSVVINKLHSMQHLDYLPRKASGSLTAMMTIDSKC
jgi:hypothetical protein